MAVVLQRERETALRLIRASEWRDEVNDGHIRRAGLYSARMAEALGWEQGRVEEIRLAAAMHDIGKVGIADGILLRAERLTAEEFEVAKKHTQMGGRKDPRKRQNCGYCGRIRRAFTSSSLSCSSP